MKKDKAFITITGLRKLLYPQPGESNPSILDEIGLGPGSTVVLVGNTGRGKTAIANALARIASPTQPIDIAFEGQTLSTMTELEIAKCVALLPTNPYLIFSALCDNLKREFELSFEMLGEPPNRQKIDEVVTALNLKELLNRDPFTFSGGEAARAAFGIAIVKQPRLIVIDDSLRSMDSQAKRMITKYACTQARLSHAAVVIFQSLPEPNELNDAHWIFALTHHCVTGSIDNCLKQLWALKEFDAMPPLQRYAGELQSRLGIKFTQMPETVDDLTRPLETKSTIDVFNLPTPSKGASEAQRGDALLLQDLEFSYRANTSFRIGPIDHTFEAGTVSALIGDNGAGKTTLLRMIAGILTLEKGTMSLGKTVLSKSLSISDRARHLNYVFQEPDDQIYLSTVEEELCEYAKNIGVPADLIKSRLNTVTRATGLDLLLAVPPVDLPKPKRRLLTVASAFITSPPVILLDEPTVLLDRKEIKAVQQLIREFQQAQGTVIFISHDLDFVSEMADHILVIDQGKITRKSHRGQEKHLWPEGAEPVFL